MRSPCSPCSMQTRRSSALRPASSVPPRVIALLPPNWIDSVLWRRRRVVPSAAAMKSAKPSLSEIATAVR